MIIVAILKPDHQNAVDSHGLSALHSFTPAFCTLPDLLYSFRNAYCSKTIQNSGHCANRILFHSNSAFILDKASSTGRRPAHQAITLHEPNKRSSTVRGPRHASACTMYASGQRMHNPNSNTQLLLMLTMSKDCRTRNASLFRLPKVSHMRELRVVIGLKCWDEDTRRPSPLITCK